MGVSTNTYFQCGPLHIITMLEIHRRLFCRQKFLSSRGTEGHHSHLGPLSSPRKSLAILSVIQEGRDDVRVVPPQQMSGKHRRIIQYYKSTLNSINKGCFSIITQNKSTSSNISLDFFCHSGRQMRFTSRVPRSCCVGTQGSYISTRPHPATSTQASSCTKLAQERMLGCGRLLFLVVYKVGF